MVTPGPLPSLLRQSKAALQVTPIGRAMAPLREPQQ